MENNLLILDNNKTIYDINLKNNHKTLCILDLSLLENINFNFNIESNNVIKVYYLSFNKNIKNKIISFHCNINENNNKLIFINNIFLNSSNVFFKFKGIDKNELINNVIDLKVNAIIENESSSFKTCPIYDFFTNTIDAKHALKIGTINNDYLDYLTSRGINLSDAKKLIFNSILNQFISNISCADSKKLAQIEINKILN